MPNKPFENEDVAAAFATYPPRLREKLLALRALIFDVAQAEQVGRIEETLKWGQPSYLTPETKSGTTVRIDRDKSSDGGYALYVNCQTSLVEDWRTHYPQLRFGGNRSVHFSSDDAIPMDAIRHCIAMALTYHRRKSAKA